MAKSSKSGAPARLGAPPTALLGEAERLMAAGRALLALPLLEQAHERAPGNPEVHRLLAVRAVMLDDGVAAVTAAQRAVELAPARADLWMVLGRAHKLAGAADDAIEGYRRAVNLDPNLAEAHVSLGIAFKNRGQLSDAIACYRRALEIKPRLAAAHANLGNALLLQTERTSGAAQETIDAVADEAQRRAVELDPNNVQARTNWARTLHRTGRGNQAVEHLNAALGLEPGNELLCTQLVGLLHELRWYDSARDVLALWLPANPQRKVSTVNAMATTLLHLGRYGESLEWARKAEAEAPDDADVLFNIACAQLHRLQQPQSLALLRRVVQRAPQHAVARESLVMCINYTATDPEHIVGEHRAFGAALPQVAPADAAPLPALLAKRRLRVAYLSGDLRRHSVSYFLEPLLEAHDPARIEVWAYHTNPHHDEVSARLQLHTRQWVNCAAMSDEDLVRRIRADAIDVLVDLSGTTADGRPEVFAMRAAPMQLGYLGYPTTSGIPSMDFRISDHVIDPAGDEHLSTERLLRCPASMFCYRPDSSSEVGELPLLRAGQVTFGSFNNLTKLGDEALALWARLLVALPRSRLLLKTRALADADVQRELHRRFEQLGVARERVLLNPWRPDLRSHLEVYQEVDIGLDTYPYNGATTTCEALWSGVPVITLRGRTHTSRMGASILSALGHPEWIADSPEAFVESAKALAAQPEALARFRREARARMQASALMDARAFARSFEELLFAGWQTCCEAQADGSGAAVVEAALAQGHALALQSEPEAALAAYQQALAAAPRNLIAAWGTARMLVQLRRVEAATEALHHVLALDRSAAPAWTLLGNMQEYQGQVTAARASYEQAHALAPSPALRLQLELLLPSVVPHGTDLPALRAEHEARLLALIADPPVLQDPLAEINSAPVNQYFRLSYQGLGNRRLHALYAQLMLAACPGLAWVAPQCRPRAGAKSPRRAGPIRIGFISHHFRQHSVGKTSVGLIERLARPEFEVTVLFIPPRRDDAMAERIAAGADHVLELPRGLAESREAIAALGLDILFYQDIGMEPHSYFLAFARLAPVQCVSFGHPDTTGIPNLDAWISIDAFEPPGAEAEYSERLIRIPAVGTIACYDRPLLEPAEAIGRAGFGLPEGVPLLACPQTLFKIHPEMDDLLAALLRRRPDARLLMVRGDVPAFQEQLLARWRARGDGIDRAAVFFPPLQHQSFLALFAVSDVVLDTLHFNGYNTSLEALSVGVPVVTLPGALQRGRHTQAMYRAMGFEELIARDEAHYVELVVRLLEDRAFHAQACARIRESCHVLFEDLAVVRGFEDAFRELCELTLTGEGEGERVAANTAPVEAVC